MDSEDSFDSFVKCEPDPITDDPFAAKKIKHTWNNESTIKLIELYSQECQELWDTNHPSYKDRTVRQQKQDYLAKVFSTSTVEINRKLHNLRCQLNSELRKIKKKRRIGGGSGDDSNVSGSGSVWEYFDMLSFLIPQVLGEGNSFEGVNMALAEFQANEEMEFGTAAQERSSQQSGSSTAATSRHKTRHKPRVAVSAPPPLPADAHPMLWPEEPAPRIRPSMNADECQIFGDFVASELRMLRSDESRKRLKRLIQKSILQVGEDEDIDVMGHPY